MGKVSSLYKFRQDSADMAPLNLSFFTYKTIYFYLSRCEFLFLLFRYLLAFVLLVFFIMGLFPDLEDEILSLSIFSFPAVYSLVLLPLCINRLAYQNLSPYLLVFHLFPIIDMVSHNTVTALLADSFLLYLIFINIYDIKPPVCERKKQLAAVLPEEYPFGLALACFSLLYLGFFLLFELDEAVISLMVLSWIFFLLARWYWPVVVLNVVGGIGVFLFFSSGFVEMKHHKNIIIHALLKISLLDSILFVIFSLSLFINMLFWLEAWQRGRRPEIASNK
ncbi:hypothetical protein [Yersinia pekkanenii]|uniref:Membrane protein n=1 Tax=Yersinia pekkanenii TaxID=1288385 RepID=A0A0T9QM79_9GAMM|nr:hypothetical protein [Yersinia pekkanenii]CNI18450.1 membrane protein [Yersinia pekkanenii]CRY64933.1 membrane protein [Yersinia pekkanenii]